MLPIQMQKQHNAMINEDIVVPRLVNTQTIEFSDWCARMANGSTVTAADVAAVMQQIENKMIENLSRGLLYGLILGHYIFYYEKLK